MNGYQSNGEYLDREFEWLRTRVRRVAAEREHRDLTGIRFGEPEEADAALLRTEEDRLRRQIDARLAAHRQEGLPELGLDRLCREHDLTEHERFVVLMLVPTAVAEPVGDEILAGLSAGSSAWTGAADAVLLLDPVGVDDWVRHRRLFASDGKLVAKGIIEVKEGTYVLGAAAGLSMDLFLTETAFRVVVGLDHEESTAD